MTMQLIEDAMGDPTNAATLATACDLAYLPEDAGKQAFREQLGMEARLISVGNTQAYIATNDEHIVVAFRGTEGPTTLEGLKDWLLTDAGNLLMVPEGQLGTDLAAAGVGARFHQGFVTALAAVWEPVFTAVQAELAKSERPLWVTGHSLGGALALLAGWLFRRRFIGVHQIYTYGAPMIGNDDAATAFDRELGGRIFRFVNMLDPIPRLPTLSLVGNSYRHCLQEMALTGAVAEAAGKTVDFFEGVASRATDGLLTRLLIDDLWGGLMQRIGAHSLEQYLGLVKVFKKG
ncbi:MAG: lipase family protein [Gemmataceae bacterium]